MNRTSGIWDWAVYEVKLDSDCRSYNSFNGRQILYPAGTRLVAIAHPDGWLLDMNRLKFREDQDITAIKRLHERGRVPLPLRIRTSYFHDETSDLYAWLKDPLVRLSYALEGS